MLNSQPPRAARSRFLMVLAAAAMLALSSCAALSEAEPIDWAAQTEQDLLADGVDRSVVDCVLNLAADDLKRAPLGTLAADEVLLHCRQARSVIDRPEPDAIPDTRLAMTDVAWTLGDDPDLDRLWRECEQGAGSACDELFERSPVGSIYEDFGVSCGKLPEVLDCAELDRPDPDTDID